MNQNLCALAALCGVLMAGCAVTTVNPVDPGLGMKRVCIQDNPKVPVPDFLQSLRDSFKRRGVGTEVFSANIPEGCSFVLTYSAQRRWDGMPYMTHADIDLWKDGQAVGSATLRQEANGGAAVAKWMPTSYHVDSLVEQLVGIKSNDPRPAPRPLQR